MKDEESGVEAAAGAAAPSLVKPRFLVKLDCDAIFSFQVEIEADSKQHAMDQAEEQVLDGEFDCDWQMDENFIRPYNTRAVSATALPATGAAATGAALNPKSL